MRRVTGIAAGIVLVLAAGHGAPGCGASSFVCESDESCAGLASGQCEADGRCSTPDAQCPSGRRYASHSGDLSGHCVGDEAADTGTSAVPHSETGGSPSSPTSADEDDGSSTTTPPATSDGDPTEGDPSGEPPVQACEGRALVDDPFDALPLDARSWEVFNDAGIAVNVIGGELRLSAVDTSSAYTDIGPMFSLPQSGVIGMELTAVPPPDEDAETYLVLVGPGAGYGFRVSAGMLELTYSGNPMELPLDTLDYDPDAYRWLRLVIDSDAEMITWEAAPALGQWDALTWLELDPDFDLGEAVFYFGAGVWEGPVTIEPLAAFGHAFVCED